MKEGFLFLPGDLAFTHPATVARERHVRLWSLDRKWLTRHFLDVNTPVFVLGTVGHFVKVICEKGTFMVDRIHLRKEP